MIMQCSRLIAEAAAHNTIGTQKRIGIVLAFHPILFKKNQNPAEQKDFVVLQVPEYEDFDLFPDGLSEAVIEVQMVKLNDKGKVEGDDVTEAKAADHSKEGKIALKVDNKVPGILKYRDQSGAQIEIAVKDLVDGHTTLDKNSPDVVKYVATTKLGEAKITTDINENNSYEFWAEFKLPKKTKKTLELKVGSRKIEQGSKGHDVMKYQWYLRRFGFLAYDEREIADRRSDNTWTNISDIGTDGDWGQRTGRASRDFQLVSSGEFRNQATTKVPITFTAAPGEPAGGEQGAECAVWHDKKYKVEPYQGNIWINENSPGRVIDAAAKIVYGALIEGTTNQGYIEVVQPVGRSRIHWATHNFKVAESIRSAIRLFNKSQMIFRLHDADPKRSLEDENVHAAFKTDVIATVRELREEQAADLTGASCSNVQVNEGFRTPDRQDVLYAKGRTTAGEPCTHKITIGQCPTHPQGNPAGTKCTHTYPVGSCTTHPLGATVTEAQGSQMASWHQFGVAVDIVFNDANGGANWGSDKNWNGNGSVGQAHGLTWGGTWTTPDIPHFQRPSAGAPSAQIKQAFNDAAAPLLNKLQAAWALL